MWRRFNALLIGSMLITSVWARRPGDPLAPGWNLFSKQQDVQLGQEASQQVRQQYEVVQDPSLQAYVRRVGDRLAATPQARQSGFQFTFTLLNVPEVNAFALPGGPMFIFTGLFKELDNEAQLAAVMSHEMSHVILRHGTHEASKANLIRLPALLAGAAAGGSMLGQLAQVGLGLGANSFILKFSRDAESEADALGSHIMAEAGYNPIEMARFFQRLAADGSRGPQFLSDHPNPGNRERAIEEEARTIPQQNYGYETGEFQRVKAAILGLPGSNKRPRAASFQPDQAAPSGGWQQYRAQTFELSYPANWNAYGDQNSSMLTIAPRDGLVAGPNGATQVGYGIMVSYFNPDSKRDLRSATDDLVHHLRAENPGMKVSSTQSRSVRVSGAGGLVTRLESNSPFGGSETDALLTVARPEGLFYMIFIAPQANFAQLEDTFQKVVDSIRFTA